MTMFSTAQVARRAGVHKDTLLRWLRAGVIPEPQRNRHGWRSFTEEQAIEVERFARGMLSPQDAAPTKPEAHEALSSINWDFQGAKTGYLTHGIHPYPAKFIPQIPNALIQELSSVGDTVGDIFCGSGTTIVEALTLKRHAIGIDANPLACLISRCKTTAVDDDDCAEVVETVEKARFLAQQYSENAPTDSLFPSSEFKSEGWRPEWPKLDFWFFPHVIEELAEILLWCRAMRSGNAQQMALVAFSSIIVAVSKQDSDTRYVRREKKIPPGETFRRFARSLDSILLACKEFTDLVEPRFTRRIVHGDILNAPSIPLMDLMVCSPPYPNAFSYHLYHMTRMLWLGMDQPLFKAQEIGSHRKYSSKGKTAANVETFKSEFTKIMRWLSVHLKDGGYACFIVGNSTLKGRRVDNARIIQEAGEGCGFLKEAAIERTMQSTKKSFNPVIGKIKTETILVMKKCGSGA